jgi:hypothetical protein
MSSETKECKNCAASFVNERTLHLPLPRLCPNCRHHERLALRNPFRLQESSCHCTGIGSKKGTYTNSSKHFHGDATCPNKLRTSYSSEKPEIVYCEQCYNAEVI